MAEKTMKRNSSASGRRAYMYGSAAPKIDIRKEMEEEPKKQLSHRTRRNREKALHMSLGYVFFLSAALIMAGFVLIDYLRLQAELTSEIKVIAKMESQLNTLKLKNDEENNRIINSVDLEDVKRVAIGELGMVYATEGQIIVYEGAGNDYMRKVSSNN